MQPRVLQFRRVRLIAGIQSRTRVAALQNAGFTLLKRTSRHLSVWALPVREVEVAVGMEPQREVWDDLSRPERAALSSPDLCWAPLDVLQRLADRGLVELYGAAICLTAAGTLVLDAARCLEAL